MAEQSAAPGQQTTAAQAQAAGRPNPYRNYNFVLDVGGDVQGHFARVSGLEMSLPAIRYREGGERQIVLALPGRPDPGQVTLEYGLTNSRALFDWFMRGINEGAPEPKNVSIAVLANDGATELVRWNLDGSWPTVWRGAALDALGSEIAIETLVLVFERIERVDRA
jgi:phage tail-like protein